MRNEKRIDLILEKIREKWKAHQDMKFHQLLQTIGIETIEDNFFMEDDEILGVLEIDCEVFK